MRDFKFDSIEYVNSSLKEIFNEIAISQSPSSTPLLPESIPQLAEKDKQEEKDEKKSDIPEWKVGYRRWRELRNATKMLLDTINPHFQKSNKELLLDYLQAVLKGYEAQETTKANESKQDRDSDQGAIGFRAKFLTNNPGFNLFISIFKTDINYAKTLEYFLEAVKQQNDVFSIEHIIDRLVARQHVGDPISGLEFEMLRDPELEYDADNDLWDVTLKVQEYRAFIKTTYWLMSQGIKLDEKAKSFLESMIGKLRSITSRLWATLFGLDLNAKDTTPEQLLAIVFKDSDSQAELDFAKFLIEHGIKLKTSQGAVELLTIALEKGPKHLQLLLEEKIDINVQDSEGNTAIMRVMEAFFNRLGIHYTPNPEWASLMAFRILLDMTTNINIRNSNGDTALIVAASCFACHHIGYILETKGVDIEARNAQGQTALSAAFMALIRNPESGLRFLSIVDALVSKGANIDAKDTNGDTVLHLAIKSSRYSHYAKFRAVAICLLKFGADPNVRDRDGKTAIELATELGFPDLLQELKNIKLKKKEQAEEKDKKKYEEHQNLRPHGKFFTPLLPPTASLNMVRFLGSLEIPPKIITSKVFKSKMESSVRDDAKDRLTQLTALLNRLEIPVKRPPVSKNTEQAFKELFAEKKYAIQGYANDEIRNNPIIYKTDPKLLIDKLFALGIIIDPDTLEEKKGEEAKEAELKESKTSDVKSVTTVETQRAFTLLFERYKDVLNVNSERELLTELRKPIVIEALKIYCKGARSGDDREQLEHFLTHSIIHQRIEFVKTLLDEGMNPNFAFPVPDKGKVSLLHQAVFNGDIMAVKVLLAKGANINAVDGNGCTPLIYAVRSGVQEDIINRRANEELIELLLQKGAQIDVPNKKGETAISCAIKNKMYRIFEKLLCEAKRRGGDAALEVVVNEHKQTPLLAVIQDAFEGRVGNPEDRFPKLYCTFLKPLFKLGVNVNARDNNGYTALMLALKNRQTELAELLLNQGANPCIEDEKGVTPLSRVEANFQYEMISLLQKAIKTRDSAVGRKDITSPKSMMFTKVDDPGIAVQSSPAVAGDHKNKHSEKFIEMDESDHSSQSFNGRKQLINASD